MRISIPDKVLRIRIILFPSRLLESESHRFPWRALEAESERAPPSGPGWEESEAPPPPLGSSRAARLYRKFTLGIAGLAPPFAAAAWQRCPRVAAMISAPVVLLCRTGSRLLLRRPAPNRPSWARRYWVVPGPGGGVGHREPDSHPFSSGHSSPPPASATSGSRRVTCWCLHAVHKQLGKRAPK